jgi:type IV secretory pathway VirB3-like protein
MTTSNTKNIFLVYYDGCLYNLLKSRGFQAPLGLCAAESQLPCLAFLFLKKSSISLFLVTFNKRACEGRFIENRNYLSRLVLCVIHIGSSITVCKDGGLIDFVLFISAQTGQKLFFKLSTPLLFPTTHSIA